MNIIVCPKCKMRILPKQDGTCPSCSSRIVAKEKTSIPDRKNFRKKGKLKVNQQNRAVMKLVATIWFFQFLAIFFGFVDIVTNNISWPWWPGIIGLCLSILLTPIFLYYGIHIRRAYIVYVLFSVLASIWMIPLLGLGFQQTTGGLFITLLVLGLCGVRFLISYRFSLHKLTTGYVEKTGILNIKRGYWDLAKNPLSDKKTQTIEESLAKILIPLGAALGVILSRVFSNESQLINSILAFTYSWILISIPASQLAIAKYLRSSETKLGKPIKI